MHNLHIGIVMPSGSNTSATPQAICLTNDPFETRSAALFSTNFAQESVLQYSFQNQR